MATPDDTTPAFESGFRRALRRLRRRSVLRTSARLVPWLLVAGLAAIVAERLALAALPAAATAAALGGVLAAAALWSAWRSPTGREGALVLDRRLGTRELLTTAHESSRGAHPFQEIVHRRAAAALDGAAVARALPLTAWRSWRPATLAVLAVVLAGFLPALREKASASLTEPDPVVEAVAETLAEELESLTDEAEELDRPEADEALERLQEMVDDMRSGELPTVEDALVALNKTEEALQSFREETATQGLDELIDDMAADPLSSDLAKAMSELDREAVRQALEKMAAAMSSREALDSAAERELQSLAQRFEELAEYLEQVGGNDMAEKVSELARALQEGDLGRAEELLQSEELADALEMAARLGKGEGLGENLGELLQTARYLLGKKNPSGGPGDGFQPSPLGRGGPRPGTTSTNRKAEGYTTGSPILRDRRSEQTSDRQGEFEAHYRSRVAEAEGFEDLLAAGQVGGEGEMLSEEGRALGVDTEASLPLRPFAGAAPGAAERAMDLESVPRGYRDLVRTYFERGDDSQDTRNREGGDP